MLSRSRKSRVYFVPVPDAADGPAVVEKLRRLIDKSRILKDIKKEHSVAVKMHFGEEGNTGFVSPEYARVICEKIIGKGAPAFLADTNTLYKGRRKDSQEHLKLAYEHGFTKAATGLDVVVPDETRKEDVVEIPIHQRMVKTAKLARFFIDADVIVGINHFKGHILTGFGGAIKNIGMGCATRQGKLAQHCDVAPFVHLNECTGCGACVEICPVNAIRIENEKSVIDKTVCVGCAGCIDVCPHEALFVDFGAGSVLQDKMAEYAYAVLKEKKAAYFNFAVKINKECDCWSMENPQIAPDVGILASVDPVAIDKASYDLVVKACGKDIFMEAHPDQDGMKQLCRAQELGLGQMDYKLIEV